MRGQRILLVDDDQDERTLTTRLLSSEDVVVLDVSGGVEFAEQLARGEFDAVIAEHHLGWADGLRVLEAVKSFYPDRPAILLTGDSDPELVSRAVALGLDALVPKTPAGYGRLPDTVRDLLEHGTDGSRAEPAYRRLTESLPVGVFSLSAATGITRANPALAELLGCREPAELWGENLESFMGESSDRRRLRAALAAGDEISGWEVRLETRHGAVAWARLTAWPHRAPASPDRVEPARGIHYDGTLEDVTSYKLTGEDLARRAAALDHSNAALQSFADVVAHDLQAPLARIDRYASLLDETVQDELGETGQGYLRQLTDAGRQMQHMLEAILEYARVTSRGRPFQEVDLESVLADVAANVDNELEATGGALTHDSLPVIQADPAQMLRLLQNLVDNALKFRRREPPQIHLSAEEADDVVRLHVADNGIGIPESDRDRIFDMFARLHPESEYPGSGVGLAICKRIAERHGGTLEVDSTPGAGSTFTVTLPQRCGLGDLHGDSVTQAVADRGR